MSEYRIEYSVQRRLPDDEDFVEVGFGSSGSWNSIDAAAHMLGSAVQTRDWETTEGMPDPDEVDSDLLAL